MSRKADAKGEDGKKKKQQAASLARRMAGKKGQTTQLQIEVNNDEDWERLISREGVIVIDVYSDWSGPCVGMIGNLKKAKVEFGGDSLHLAIAKNDEIECLARFRNRSEPTWLFAAGGQLVNGMFGANAPKLLKMIDSEVKREIRVLKGETWRQGVPFTEMCDEEKERLKEAEKLKSEADRLEEERRIRALEARRMKMYNHMAEHLLYETVLICFPHLLSSDSPYAQELDSLFRSQMLYIHSQTKVVITREMFDEIFFKGALEPTDDLMDDLASGPCHVYLLKSQIVVSPGQEGEKLSGDLEKSFCEALNMISLERGQEFVVPDPMSIPAKYPYIRRYKLDDEGEEEEDVELIEEETSIPGCWTPATYVTKCACVRYLFHARAEKVMLVEPEDTGQVVIGYETSKWKECFELMEEYPDDVLDYGFFNSGIAGKAEQLCATPEQYEKLEHQESDRLIIVLKKVKSEPLLTFAGMGASYVSHDEQLGKKEAALFFPLDPSERKFPQLEEAERIMAAMTPFEEEPEEEEPEEEDEEEQEEQDEEDLMALLGLPIE